MTYTYIYHVGLKFHLLTALHPFSGYNAAALRQWSDSSIDEQTYNQARLTSRQPCDL